MLVSLTLLHSLLACRVAKVPREPGPLVDPELWEWVGADADPFGDRPDTVDCPDDAWPVEIIGADLSLSVDTADCDYLTARQPALMDVEPGDALFMRLWHYELNAGEAASAHAALQLGDVVSWEEDIPIPSESGMIAPTWTVEDGLTEGDDVYFHLHNHGANSYNLIEVSVIPPEP